MYVGLRSLRILRTVEDLLKAANHMVKFGWRAVSYAQGVCLVERVDTAGR
jgi:hypothetical protein